MTEQNPKPEWTKPLREPERRCPRCWTILTWYEDDVGRIRLWCFNCQAPFHNPINVAAVDTEIERYSLSKSSNS